jgi:hypothetical protein
MLWAYYEQALEILEQANAEREDVLFQAQKRSAIRQFESEQKLRGDEWIECHLPRPPRARLLFVANAPSDATVFYQEVHEAKSADGQGQGKKTVRVVDPPTKHELEAAGEWLIAKHLIDQGRDEALLVLELAAQESNEARQVLLYSSKLHYSQKLLKSCFLSQMLALFIFVCMWAAFSRCQRVLIGF